MAPDRPTIPLEQERAPPVTPASFRDRALVTASLLLAAWSWGIVLAVFNVADGDLWAKLALGAHFYEQGSLPARDFFAFTPVLPSYVDHEWGSGLVFYSLLRWLGPGSLLLLKAGLGTAALALALAVARRLGSAWPWLLILLLPAAACLLPGYVPVIRSHTFTYVCFALTLWLLQRLDQPSPWPVGALGLLMAAWVNLHGGLVAGLGMVASFALFHWRSALVFRRALIAAGLCGLATLLNPWGPGYWRVLLAALLHPRTAITEWQPLPWWGLDSFTGFRVFFVLVLCAVALGWKEVTRKSYWRLFVVAITAFLAWRSRRHAPFFGIAGLAYAEPYFAAAYRRVTRDRPCPFKLHWSPLTAGLLLWGVLAMLATYRLLPRASVQVLAPVGEYPVREADILSLAKAEGNAAVPFHWGSYLAWRLYPAVRISFDGRYEAAFPESTFRMNEDFFNRRGPEWTRLIREFPVDFIILDLHTQPLRPEDVQPLGYALVWQLPKYSALVAKTNRFPALASVAAGLPDTTIDPLDASIPRRWLAVSPRESAPTR